MTRAPSVSVITPALPSRAGLLASAIRSVADQTVPVVEHLISVDVERNGTSYTRNRLHLAARGDWIVPLDDDDRLHPTFVEHVTTGVDLAAVDVVYTDCRVEGRDGWTPSGPFDPERLRAESYIPVTALIRSDLLRDLRGWRGSSACLNGWEDYDLWLRALDQGARFAYVPGEQWTYRLHAGSKTLVGEKGAR